MKKVWAEIWKLWCNTTQGPNGKYGRKSLTWLIGTYMSVYVMVKGVATGAWAPDYVFMFLLFWVLGLAAVSVFDKIKNGGKNE